MENDGKRPEVWHLMAKPFSRFSWTVERRQDGRSTLTLTLTHLLPMINSLVLQSATKCYKYTTKFTKSSTAFESSTNLVKMIRKNSHHGGYSYSSASTFRRCSSIKSWKFAAGNKDQRKSIKCKSTCSYLHAGLHRTILALRHLPILVQNMSEISLAKHLMTSPACFSMFFHESFTTPFEHFWNFPFDLLALTGSHRLSATPSTSPLALWASPLAQLLDASWVSEFHRSQKLPTMRHYAISMPSVCHGPKNVQNTNWSSTFVLPVEVSTVPCEGMGLDSRLLLERSGRQISHWFHHTPQFLISRRPKLLWNLHCLCWDSNGPALKLALSYCLSNCTFRSFLLSPCSLHPSVRLFQSVLAETGWVTMSMMCQNWHHFTSILPDFACAAFRDLWGDCDRQVLRAANTPCLWSLTVLSLRWCSAGPKCTFRSSANRVKCRKWNEWKWRRQALRMKHCLRLLLWRHM